jgi:hypothetical protein
MLFLLNDTLLDLDAHRPQQPLDGARFQALSLAYLIKLGQEMFAESPLLQRHDAKRASRLAMLIVAKAPEVNAALFMAPSRGCRPDQVATRFASLGIDVMGALYAKERDGLLNPVTADREVWRRMAA